MRKETYVHHSLSLHERLHGGGWHRCVFNLTLFVNSATLIVAGARLFSTGGANKADLFGIFDMLTTNVAPAAGTFFALFLLFSDVSAGLSCTLASQTIAEDSLQWSIALWNQRLVARTMSITPSTITAGTVGRLGLFAALEESRVVPYTSVSICRRSLIWFAYRGNYMIAKAPHFRDDV